IEAMTRSENFQGIVFLDELPNLIDRCKLMHVVRAVSVVTGPVGEPAARRGVISRPAQESGPGRSAQDRGRLLEECSLVHGRRVPSDGRASRGADGTECSLGSWSFAFGNGGVSLGPGATVRESLTGFVRVGPARSACRGTANVSVGSSRRRSFRPASVTAVRSRSSTWRPFRTGAGI